MRITPILVAVLVALALYGFVFERDRLVALVSGDFEAVTQEAPEPAVADAADEPTVQTATDDLVAVVVRELQAAPVQNGVLLRGRTEADREVEVRSQISGLVISSPYAKGSLVEEGEVICEIDPGARYADLAEARARLAEAVVSDTAAFRLAEDGFASETRKVAARAALEAATAAVERAETEIERLTIRAPFDGLLETDSAELGSLMQPGAACATVIRLDPIRVVGFLPETEVDAVEIGAIAQARMASGREVIGEVTFVSRAADPITRTFRVDIAVDNPDLSIRDGQTAEIAIAASTTIAHQVPASALTLDDTGTMGLRLVDDGDLTRFYPVQIVRDTQTGLLVTGLPDMARVIIRGQEYVTDGVRVTAVLEGDAS